MKSSAPNKRKIYLFDVDGVIVRGPKWSRNIEADCGIARSQLDEFFERDFEACLEGRADLKEALRPWLARWRYPKSVDDFVHYWFTQDSHLDAEVLGLVETVSKQHTCFLATNQEAYRTRFLMEDLKLSRYFNGVFAAFDLGCAKPRHEYFETLLSRLRQRSLDGCEIYFVDDAIRNVEEARRHSIKAHHFTGVEALRAWVKETLDLHHH